MSEGKYKAQAKWKKNNTKQIVLTFYTTSEADVLEYLEQRRPYNGNIKRLIREDMERTKKK